MQLHRQFKWVVIIMEARHESLQLFCGTICYMCLEDLICYPACNFTYTLNRKCRHLMMKSVFAKAELNMHLNE